MSDNTIQITAGSSATVGLRWLQASGGDPIDVTNYDVEVFDAHPDLVANIDVAITDAAAGQTPASFTWADGMPSGRVMFFQPRLVPKAGFPSLLPIASPRIWIEVLE